MRSTNGAHRKCVEYAAATVPNTPIADRVRPDSFSHAVMAEPHRTHGNPLAMPKMKMVKMRRSR